MTFQATQHNQSNAVNANATIIVIAPTIFPLKTFPSIYHMNRLYMRIRKMPKFSQHFVVIRYTRIVRQKPPKRIGSWSVQLAGGAPDNGESEGDTTGTPGLQQ